LHCNKTFYSTSNQSQSNEIEKQAVSELLVYADFTVHLLISHFIRDALALYGGMDVELILHNADLGKNVKKKRFYTKIRQNTNRI